jgi:UDP-sulfoquinovose synthase
VQIFNQMTETHRVRDLASMIAERTGSTIDYLPNPRAEADENDLHVVNGRLLALGLEPLTLSAGLMDEITGVATKYAHRCDRSKIPCSSFWNKAREEASIRSDVNSRPDPTSSTSGANRQEPS